MDENECLFEIKVKDNIVGHTKVDKKYHEILNKCASLYIDKDGYVICKIDEFSGFLHRYIMEARKGDLKVDHKNGDRLDNRSCNLRFATDSQNVQNSKKREGTTSKYKGVSKSENLWRCEISFNNKRNLFYFKNEEHAAYNYNILALKYYGTECKLNDVIKPDDFIEPIKQEKVKKYKYKARETVNKEELIKRNDDGQAVIKLNKNKILFDCIVDDETYYDLIKYKWFVNSDNYATGRINGVLTLMHRYLLKCTKGDNIVDHVNNNRLDNRLTNIRKSNDSLNSHNKSKKKNATSTYKGVIKRGKNFMATISKDHIKYQSETFKSESDAAIWYNNKAIELYGEYASVNKITE